MGIANTASTDYSGRQKDISIFQYPDATLEGPQNVDVSFGTRPRFCSGVQKLVQRYAIMLMTNIGSQPFYSDFGTSLLFSLQTGVSPTDKLAAAQLFRLASFDVVVEFKKAQRVAVTPPDERIVSADLIDIVLQGGAVSFSVSIKTEAESVLDFLVPLPK